MHVPKRFWQTLERMPGLSASVVEWRDALGPDWTWGSSLLRPTQEQAETVMLSSGPHRVVVHAADRAVAVPIDGGRAQSIERDDAAILELNPARLAGMICGALGFEQASGRLRSDGLYPNMARLAVTRAITAPVHLCMHFDGATMHAAIRRLLVEGDGPMVILTPTPLVDPDISQIVRMRCACHVALADAIELDATTKAAPTEYVKRALGEFSKAVEDWELRPTPTEPFRFARSGRVWVLAFNRIACLMPHKDAGGLAYIQHLLARAGQEIPVESLEQMVTGNAALDAVSMGDAVVDRPGLERIWADMRRVKGDMDAAERNGDLAAQSRLQTEYDALGEQVRGMHGLNDRVRRLGDQTEQLRSKVTNSIRRAIKALEADGGLPALAAHLAAIRCGRTLSYRPDSTIAWDFTVV